MQSELLLEQVSPHGNLKAFVEQDRRVAYLYLQGPGDSGFGVKACWIRNLGPAPAQLSTEEMKVGIAPMLPAQYCADPKQRIPLDASKLSLVWFVEGDGVALLEDQEIIAAIPPWGGHGEFNGYARDCIGQSPLCWKLDATAAIDQRVETANKYWRKWTDNALLWDQIQNGFIYAYEDVLGKHNRYFAIDGGVWPPKAMVNIVNDGFSYFLTVGVSVRSQPQVELYYEDPKPRQRIELACRFNDDTNPETMQDFAGYLSSLTALPWATISFLANGHTIECDVFAKDVEMSQFTAILLLEMPAWAPRFDLPEVDDATVRLLWAVPITSAELDQIQEKGIEEFLQESNRI